MAETEARIQHNPFSITLEKVKPMVGTVAEQTIPSESSSLIMKSDENQTHDGVIVNHLLWVLWPLRSNNFLHK